MTVLRLLAENAAVKALGWTVLHLIWEGAAIALGLGAVLSVARSARVRYAAACGALVLALTGFAGTFLHLSGGELAGRGALAALPDALRDGRLPYPGTGMTPEGPMDLAAWAALLWLAGVVLFYVRAAGGWFSVYRWRHTGVCAADAVWLARLAQLQERLRISRPVLLLQSGLAETPLAMGYLRPVILMPVGLLTGMPERQVEYILLHELAHIRRHDYLVNLLQTLTEGFLFYHPAVWWISGVIRAERENCCDDVAASHGDAYEYAATLAALEGFRQPAGEPALAATGGNLMKRIRRLLQQPEGPPAALTPIFLAGLIVLSVGIGLAYQAAGLPAPGQARNAQARDAKADTADGERPLDKWIWEDVAYIATNEERAAFRRLATVEEQEEFVRQFWERRDPTPGTPANEFKEEHYRRIAYTNRRFAGGGVAGWKTDRGRIYITYGPPDEIDAHPSGGKYTRPAEQGGGETTVYPFQEWRYRYIEGIGQGVMIDFVDSDGTGVFRMTTDPHGKESKNPGN
jgi:GWxTD domain-containing protein